MSHVRPAILAILLAVFFGVGLATKPASAGDEGQKRVDDGLLDPSWFVLASCSGRPRISTTSG